MLSSSVWRTLPQFFQSAARHSRALSRISNMIRTDRFAGSSSSSVISWKRFSYAKMAERKEIHNYLAVAKRLALEVGEIFKSAITLEKHVETKTGDCDLVTEYDKQIEDILVKGLSASFPDHKFIGEESTGVSKSLPELTDSPTWFIDPIDGTTNFIHAFPQCCISIGLTICKQLGLGLIYNPSNNEMYTAIRGEGAFLNGKRIKPSKVTEMKKSLIYIEPGMIRAPSKCRDILLARLEATIGAAQGTRSLGSAALGLAYVANGTLDAFQMDYLGPWDVAAGIMIVEEAGGTVIHSKGGPFDLMKPKIIATSTEHLAKEFSKLIVDVDLQTQRKRLKRVPSSTKLL